MARISSQPTLESGLPSLVPHGRFKGKPAMPLGRPVTVIGARNRSHLHLVSSSVSKSHAMVVNSGGGFYVRDLASRTHIYINQREVVEANLRDGDILAVGPFTFRFTDPKSGTRSRTHAVPKGVLRVVGRALPIELVDRVLLIGRRPTCDLALDEIEVSTTHAVIFEMDGKRHVRDLGSRTGTYVNGVLVHQQALEFGDSIRIGNTELAYAAAAGTVDELDDLASTAQLPAEESIDFASDETPQPVARPAEPTPIEPEPAPIAAEIAPPVPVAEPAIDDELGLQLTPSPSEAKAPPPAPIAPPPTPMPVPPPVADAEPEDLTLSPLPVAPSSDATPAVDELDLSEPATESTLGIELLPADDAETVPSAEKEIEAPAPDVTAKLPAIEPELDGGLDFGEPTEPAAEVQATVSGKTADAAPTADESADGDKSKKSTRWKRLFGRKKDEAEAVSEASPISVPPIERPAVAAASVPAEPIAELPAEEELDLGGLELEPESADIPAVADFAPAADEASEPEKIETVEKTEPTLESALGIAEVLPVTPEASDVPTDISPGSADSLTDSVFHREVEAFEGPGLGPIVEPAANSLAPVEEEVPLYGIDAAPEEAEVDPLIFEEVSPVSKPTAEAPSADRTPATDEALPPPPVEETPAAVAEQPEPNAELTEVAAPVHEISVEEAPEVEAAEEAPPPIAEQVEPTPSEPSASIDEVHVEEASPKGRGGKRAAGSAKTPRRGAKRKSTADVQAETTEAPAVADAAIPLAAAVAAETVSPSAEAVTASADVPLSVDPETSAAVVGVSVPAESEAPAFVEETPALAQVGIPLPPPPREEISPVDEVSDEPVAAEIEPAADVESRSLIFETPESADLEPEPAPATPEVAATGEPEVTPAAAEVVEAEPLSAAVVPLSPLEETRAAEVEAADEPVADIAADSATVNETPLAPTEPFTDQIEAVASAANDVEPEAAESVPAVSEPVVPKAEEVTARPADFEIPVADAIDEPLDLELEAAMSADDASMDELDLGEPLPETRAPHDPPVFEESGRAVDAAAITETTPGEPTTEPAPGTAKGALEKSTDLFYGLERDTASFFGGMPLELPPLQGPSAAPAVSASSVGDEPAASSAPPVESPRAGYPAPPPPARAVVRERVRPENERVVASPFDLNFDDVPTDKIAIPPFAGSGPATSGQVTTAFDGLAMPPVHETDVFSQTNVGASGAQASPFGGIAGGVGSGSAESDAYDDHFDDDEPPLDLSGADDGDEPVPAEAGVQSADEVQAETSEKVTEARAGRATTAASRRPPAYPSEPAVARPKKKRWRIGKWGFFGLMLLCMGAVSGGIYWLLPGMFPNTALIIAKIRFQKFDSLSKVQKGQVLAEQRGKLESPEVRASAREILDNAYEGVSPGFLRETGSSGEVKAAADAYLKLSASMKLVEAKSEIQFQYDAIEGESDRVRLRALLDALHVVNKPLIDSAVRMDREIEEKSQKRQVDAEIYNTVFKPAADAAQQAAGDQNASSEKTGIVEALRQKDGALSAEWTETTARVKALTADLRSVESEVPFDPKADPAKRPATPDDDVQVADLSARIAELAANVEKKKQDRAARTDDARKTLASAIKQFENDIAKARGSMKEDSELGQYLESAARMQRQLKDVSDELGAQQRSGMERLTMLKSKLAAKNEQRIRQAFATDPDLQAIQENLALKERQYNTAVGSRLKDDARSLDKEIKGLRLEIESRQDLLTTADGIAPDKDLEVFINETLKSMESDRARNDRRMGEMLKELASQAPAAGSLPAEQKAFAEQLEKRQKELNAARQKYTAAADAATAEADEELKTLESELAAAQVKVDDRKKQLAEAARETMSDEQRRDRTVATDRQKRELERAQKADQAAADAYWANRRALNDATDELAKITKRSEAFAVENQRATEKQKEIQALSEEVDKLIQQRSVSVVPLAPSEEDVSVLPQVVDQRKTYVLAANLILVILFFGIIHFAPAHSGYEPGENDDEEIPYATASDPDDSALAAALAVEGATEHAHRGGRRGASVVA